MGKDGRKSSRERGYTGKWEKERKAYLLANPVCVVCEASATVVDHIKPHKSDKKLFWSRSNWQPLCASCHSRKTARQDGGFGNEVTQSWTPRCACDEDGRPVDNRHWWNNRKT